MISGHGDNIELSLDCTGFIMLCIVTDNPIALNQSQDVWRTSKIAHHSAPVQAVLPKCELQSESKIMQTRSCNAAKKNSVLCL